MYLLDTINVCSDTSLQPLWTVIGTIINIIWIGIPIILIILGSIDLGKAVISSKEDEVKKAKKAFINRLIYAVLVFCVVWLVTFIFDQVAKLGLTDVNQENATSWKTCWKKIRG